MKISQVGMVHQKPMVFDGLFSTSTIIYYFIIFFWLFVFLDLHLVQILVKFTWNMMLLNYKIMNLK